MINIIDIVAHSRQDAFNLVCNHIAVLHNINIDDVKQCLVIGVLNDGGDVFEIKLKTKSKIKSLYFTYCDWIL